ncbi:BTAD domain-containing putative transcriptional regulator [Phytohabitans aurantiacus]|nr:BTAD domain-containing putative transcriptional regulator [Phytohabitans aurantiacus]
MDRSRLPLRVDLLGPLAVMVEGRTVDVPGSRRRALLALLALEAGRTVGVQRLIEALWPDDPPDNAVQALYNHISRVRGHLGLLAGRLERRANGYRLHLEPWELDVDAVQRLAPDDPGAALSLWRGPALEEFRSLPELESESVRLGELKLELVDEFLERRLATGEHVAADAAAAATAAPLRERTAFLQIRALAAEGRAAEAMTAAQAFRRRLVHETGLDPTPALAELEKRVAAGTLGRQVLAARVARPIGPMIGRQHEREEVLRLLADHAVVILTGAGGVGKTRLGLDIAADADEAVVVPLAVVDRAEHVCQAVASTLGLRMTGEVHPADIAAALADRSLFLLLDNCEHVAAACRDLVVAISRSSPGVRVLATSRVTLQVPGEYVVRLQTLPVPHDAADLDALRRRPSVRAFVEHARRRRPSYELAAEEAADLVEILQRLDGLPLGIELAARQVGLMPMRDVLTRLDRALDLATGLEGPEAQRQRTLRATIASSYRLLTPDQQWLLRAIAPFAGGVDVPTVEALSVGLRDDPVDLLHRLVDASLLVADPVAGRYRLLFTVRAFLHDEIDLLAERDEASARFVSRCRVVAEEIGTRMPGAEEARVDRRLRAELDNLRAARDLASFDDRVAITLGVNQVATWRDLPEIWSWATELAADSTLVGHPSHPAILAAAAEAARLTGELDEAERLAREAIDAGDEIRGWSVLGVVAHFRGDFGAARQDWLQAAATPSPDEATFVGSAALAAAYDGDRASARSLLDRARVTSRCGSHRAFVAYVEGELLPSRQAIACYSAAIREAISVGCSFIEGVARVSLASAQARTGDVAGAANGFAYLIEFWRRTGQTTQLWTTARNAAELLASAGRPSTAALLLIVADAIPGAAAVSPEIARHSARSFVRVEDIVDKDELQHVRNEAAKLGGPAVLDRAVTELGELASRHSSVS